MKRLLQNKRLRVCDSTMYNGLPVLQDQYTIVYDFYVRGMNTVEQALNHYPRTYAVHVVLKLPEGEFFDYRDNGVINRFKEAFNGRIANHVKAHHTIVRYIDAREQHESINPHFHFILLFNHHAYNGVGEKYPAPGIETLYTRIVKSWDSANGFLPNDYPGLVHVDREFHVINRDPEELARLSECVSYLAKAETKIFGPGYHVFHNSKY